MSKLRFLLAFLFWFAVLLVVWTHTDAALLWQRALVFAGAYLGPTVHGWNLVTSADGPPTWVHGEARVPLGVNFEALAVGVVPALALLAATPSATVRRRLTLCGLGIALMFAAHLVAIVLFPLLTFHKNAVTDVTGTFVGLVAFVGAPVIIWFWLVYDQLKEWLPALRR